MGKKALKFEEALAKLEEIAREIEEGEVGLEDSISKYEEGMKLLKQCREILEVAEQRITRLQPDSPGSATDGA